MKILLDKEFKEIKETIEMYKDNYNKALEDYNKDLNKQLDKLEDRINKAIEYIENNKQILIFADLRKDGTNQYTIECDADDLLDILKGEENEN